MDRAFRYQDTTSVPVFGDMGTYPSGGYIADLTEEYSDIVHQIQVRTSILLFIWIQFENVLK